MGEKHALETKMAKEYDSVPVGTVCTVISVFSDVAVSG
jgi:hypothetical protein